MNELTTEIIATLAQKQDLDEVFRHHLEIAINLANLKMLLRLFSGPILIFVKYKQESILIHYQIHVSGSRNVA
uniref:Mobile element protein n=1 Tax=Ligilactobacillus acidipiscis TaxID=89059 RepID=A0A2R8FG29_9LACO|nr:hypothetical protein [Ligilactobacillus acidipiscis]SPO49426.1 Mobile element protein [Ligilactobacillus acidipiscis]